MPVFPPNCTRSGGKFGEVESCLSRALIIFQDARGREDPSVGTTLLSLGSAFFAQDKCVAFVLSNPPTTYKCNLSRSPSFFPHACTARATERLPPVVTPSRANPQTFAAQALYTTGCHFYASPHPHRPSSLPLLKPPHTDPPRCHFLSLPAPTLSAATS